MSQNIVPRTVAYLRVSTIDQDLEKNKADILHLANEKNLGRVEFMQEKVSGKVSWKLRKIGQLLEQLDKGDVILLSEFSRLGRSMLECMEIISIAMQKGIKIYTVKGNWQLDNTIQSKVMAGPPWRWSFLWLPRLKETSLASGLVNHLKPKD